MMPCVCGYLSSFFSIRRRRRRRPFHSTLTTAMQLARFTTERTWTAYAKHTAAFCRQLLAEFVAPHRFSNSIVGHVVTAQFGRFRTIFKLKLNNFFIQFFVCF